MANEKLLGSNTLEQEPEEYRIVLRRGAVYKDMPAEDTPDDEPSAEDIIWEGVVHDLKNTNLWEEKGLVPTIEPDLYELQLKIGENDYQFVALFGSEEDYESVIDEVTREYVTPPGEKEPL